MPKNTAYNINFPAKTTEKIKGLKVCRQNKGSWDETFDERVDPYNGKYFWMAGDFVSAENSIDTDVHALENNFASLVPCHADMTNYAAMIVAKKLEF